MIIKLNKSFAILITLNLLSLYISGCTSTKPSSDQDNFAPDSVSNLLTELSDGNIVEYYENGLYEYRNSNGELLDQGNYLYNKIDGKHGEVVFNNGDNPYIRESFNLNFTKKLLNSLVFFISSLKSSTTNSELTCRICDKTWNNPIFLTFLFILFIL